MIVQAIGLLDDLDKELNTYAMRVREWYGWHFPELTKIVQDNILYAKTVKLMGDRVNAAKLDFSEVWFLICYFHLHIVASNFPLLHGNIRCSPLVECRLYHNSG